jgi:hypothetical protein
MPRVGTCYVCIHHDRSNSHVKDIDISPPLRWLVRQEDESKTEYKSDPWIVI